MPADLHEAVRQLEQCHVEAAEEGYPIPSKLAFDNAWRLLLAMYDIAPASYDVYPSPDGEVAIDVPDGHNGSILVLCDSDGSVLCLGNSGDIHDYHRYQDPSVLPDDFLKGALAGIKTAAP